MIGYETLGKGERRVIVLNDWMCDTSTWDAARAYLDTSSFTWVFADLRGYGRSRGQSGEHIVEEAASDVLALVEALGWTRCSIVGHSMSSLVGLHLAQHEAERVERVVLLTPPPPRGFGADASRLDAMRGVALGDDAARMDAMGPRLGGERLPEGWVRFKLARWRATSDPAAVAAYVAMFAQRGLPDPAARVAAHVLAVTGEHDIPVMRRASVEQLLTSICDRLTVTSFADCGHYPMQEAPPLTVAIIERFLSAKEP